MKAGATPAEGAHDPGERGLLAASRLAPLIRSVVTCALRGEPHCACAGRPLAVTLLLLAVARVELIHLLGSLIQSKATGPRNAWLPVVAAIGSSTATDGCDQGDEEKEKRERFHPERLHARLQKCPETSCLWRTSPWKRRCRTTAEPWQHPRASGVAEVGLQPPARRALARQKKPSMMKGSALAPEVGFEPTT